MTEFKSGDPILEHQKIANPEVDYGSAQTSYTRMQEMADAASIAAARELVLANADDDQIESVAKLNVVANHAEKPILF